MIKLKDVSVNCIPSEYISSDVRELIDSLELRSIEDLINVMEYDENINWDKALNGIKVVYQKMRKHDDKEPVIYATKSYDNEELSEVDRENYGDILLLDNPTTPYAVTFNSIKEKRIDVIKRDLNLCTPDCKNYLMKSCPKLGVNGLAKVINALNMYNDQVVRQSKLVRDYDFNVFASQYLEKEEIVREYYSKIINYLLESTNSLYWGELTDYQKKVLSSSVVNNNKLDNLVKNRMVDAIACYQTLPELEEVSKDNYQSLRRIMK